MCLKYNKHCRSVFYHYESALLVLIAFIIIYCCINFFQMEQYLADGVIGRRDSDILKQSKLYSYLDDDEDNLHKPTFPIITKKPPSIEIKIAKSTSTQAVDKKSSTKSFTTTATEIRDRKSVSSFKSNKKSVSSFKSNKKSVSSFKSNKRSGHRLGTESLAEHELANQTKDLQFVNTKML